MKDDKSHSGLVLRRRRPDDEARGEETGRKIRSRAFVVLAGEEEDEGGRIIILFSEAGSAWSVERDLISYHSV
jgi:hypothetical protein